MKAIFYPEVDFGTLFLPHMFKEIYLDKVYSGILEGTKDLTILDIGANIGEVTRFMRPHAKKVYSVEPSPLEFEALKQNKEYNGWDNVEVFQLAIMDRDGEMDLSIGDKNRTANTMMLKGEGPDGYHRSWLTDSKGGEVLLSIPDTFSSTVKVQTRRMDTFFKENGIDHVDLMKLDIEGAEYLVLKGEGFLNVKDKIDVIVAELHYPQAALGLVAYMYGIGFGAKRIPTEADVVVFSK